MTLIRVVRTKSDIYLFIDLIYACDGVLFLCGHAIVKYILTSAYVVQF